jgi:CHAT domain-containing protein
VVVAAGPGLPGAELEAKAVAAAHRASALTGSAATVRAVTSALDSAALAHLAAHGTVRADNPQFSALRLADGPLMVYDVQHVERAPHTVVIAACDTGRSIAPVGDELMGLSATFLAQGTAQLIASVIPVHDGETAELMIGLHERLVDGEPAAAALAGAQEAAYRAGPEGLAVGAGFVCFGAGLASP